MKKQETYKLNIGAFTPDTIPMHRLSEYMLDLAKIMGEKNDVRFVKLAEGSTIIEACVEHEVSADVHERICSIDSNSDVGKYFKRLNQKLAEDNAKGTLEYTHNHNKSTNILHFPGKDTESDYGAIKQSGEIDGIPVSLSATHVQLRDGDKIHTGISVDEKLAVRIADECFLKKRIRLSGLGYWARETDEWKLTRFVAQDYVVLDNLSLLESVKQARAELRTDSTENPLNLYNKLRED